MSIKNINEYKEKILITHHAFAADANVYGVRVALGAILHLVSELDHDRFFAVELQSVGGIMRKRLFNRRFLSQPTASVFQRLLATADQSTRPGRIVMWIPF